MNQTETEKDNNFFDYIFIAELSINLLLAFWTSYKLNHLAIFLTNPKCCGKSCCDNFSIEIDSD